MWHNSPLGYKTTRGKWTRQHKESSAFQRWARKKQQFSREKRRKQDETQKHFKSKTTMKDTRVNEPFTGVQMARESHGIRNVQSIKACNRRATNCVTINNTANNRSKWKNYRREISLRCFLFTLRNLWCCLLFSFDISILIFIFFPGNIFDGNFFQVCQPFVRNTDRIFLFVPVRS